jgi:tripartite-type tricarboxylate transporter receptor subunit TctC
MSRIPNALAVRKDFPAATAQEFIAYAKAHPGKLNYGSQGTGTASHLTAELFMTLTDPKLVHIPYKGSGPVLNDLIAGHIDCSFIPFSTAFELAKSGNLRILAVTTSARMSLMPDITTMAEIGYLALVSATWNAISAPPKTPSAIVNKLNAEINAVLLEPQIQSRFRDLQLISAGGDIGETRALVEKERRQWGEVVKAANIEPE